MMPEWTNANLCVIRHSGIPLHSALVRSTESPAVARTGGLSTLTRDLTATGAMSPATRSALALAYRRDYEDWRTALQDIVATDLFRLALHTIAPARYREIITRTLASVTDTRLRSQERRRLRSLYMFAQRLMTKSETNGWFGPTSWAVVEPKQPANMQVQDWASIGERIRLSHWVGECLARAAAGQQTGPWRASPEWQLAGDCAVYRGLNPNPMLATITVPINGDERTILAVLKEPGSIDDVTRQTGINRQRVVSGLQTLTQAGLVIRGPKIPSDHPDPLAWLVQTLADLPETDRPRWRKLATCLADLCRSYTAGDADARDATANRAGQLFKEHTGREPTRSARGHYSDYSVLYTDADSGQQAIIGGQLAQSITEDLGAALDAIYRSGIARWLYRRRHLARAFLQEHGAGARLPLLQFTRWARARLPTAEFNPTDWPIADVPVAAAPDLCLAAESVAAINRGQYTLILGECHTLGSILMCRAYADGAPDQSALVRTVMDRLSAAVSGSGLTLARLCGKYEHKGSAEVPLPVVDIEAPGPSSKPAGMKLPISSVAVGLRDGRLSLLAGDRCLWLIDVPGGRSVTRDIWRLFSFPWPDAEPAPEPPAFLPEQRVRRVITRRDTWLICAGDIWPGIFLMRRQMPDAFVLACHCRQQQGWPQLTFVRLPTEPKPIFCNWDDPVSVDTLLRRINRPDDILKITAMLPSPPDLWWEHGGGRCVSEIRILLVRVPDHSSGRWLF